ncbi:MAG: ATP-binding protein [Candidatus Zixiibacteriota bacterium]
MSNAEDKKKGKLGEWLYKGLFEQVPFNIAVIDREFNIVEANKNFDSYFGKWKNKKCYEVYKKLDSPCVGCNAILTFQDGRVRVRDDTGIDQHGNESHYVVHIAPLRKSVRGKVDYIVEMSRDIVETKNLQMQYQLLFERVPCYVTIIDRNYKIVRANENFREKFGDVHGKQCYEVYKKRKNRCPNCPAAKTFKDGQVHHSNQVGVKKSGEKAHYMLTTSPLSRDIDNVPHVIEISVDITETKRLEREVIEAERLAAVGQTVAGLAHSIKNLLMGLEGGMYIVGRGLKANKKEMITEGWEMLERNLTKTTSLVRDFLSFAKGRLPELDMVDPNELVHEIIDLYGTIAETSGVRLIAKTKKTVKRAPLDRKGIHTCLTNLVSNAIDACQMSKRKGCEVVVGVDDKQGVLTFTVSDNGMGMDYDIKKKLFTTFFTTKGGQGTGLGLLTTRKIVKEHGGKITVDSSQIKGSCFKMSFPRKNLKSLFTHDSLVE